MTSRAALVLSPMRCRKFMGDSVEVPRKKILRFDCYKSTLVAMNPSCFLSHWLALHRWLPGFHFCNAAGRLGPRCLEAWP
jgi:hypothetical protein